MPKVIPSKLMSFVQNIGAESLKQIKSEKVRLTPFGVNSATPYSPTSLNTILFRFPSFANSF